MSTRKLQAEEMEKMEKELNELLAILKTLPEEPADPRFREALKKMAVVTGGVVAVGAGAGIVYELAKSSKNKKVIGETAASIPPTHDTLPTQHKNMPTIKADSTEVVEEVVPKKDTVKTEPEKAPAKENKDVEEFGRLAEKMDMHFYKEVLDDPGRLVYLFRVTDEKEQREHPGHWLLLDKKTATLYVIDGNNKLVRSGPVLLGRETGDHLNNLDTDEDDHWSTPPTFSILSKEHISDADREEYGGNLWRIPGTGQERNIDIFIHGLLGKPEEKAPLKTKKSEDKRISHGCIRDPKILEDQKNFTAEKTRIAILAENPGIILNPETKKTEICRSEELKARLQTIVDKNK